MNLIHSFLLVGALVTRPTIAFKDIPSYFLTISDVNRPKNATQILAEKQEILKFIIVMWNFS